MLYAAKCYWPGVTQADLEQVAERAARAGQQLAILRPQYPHWELWYVRTFKPNGIVWCARPTGSPIATINADTRVPHR
jgi:hypothetical protein